MSQPGVPDNVLLTPLMPRRRSGCNLWIKCRCKPITCPIKIAVNERSIIPNTERITSRFDSHKMQNTSMILPR